MEAKFYLSQLVIQNFATFKNQTIGFKPGFNAIVGETGSGKSLVLDALQMILGHRADKKIVRRETEYSLIEATFHCQDLEIKNYLSAEGYPFDGHELMIKRLIYKNGTSKTYINHLSCTLNFLAQFSRRYIDLVGQFENQKLLSEGYQLKLLDHFAKNHELISSYQSLLKKYKDALKLQTDLQNSQTQREQRLDYLTYQLQEIEKLDPSSQDEEDLLRRKMMLINLEKTQKLSFQIGEVFDGSDGQMGIFALLGQLDSLLTRNKDLCSYQHESLNLVEDKLMLLQQELDKTLNQDIDPNELEGVIERLDVYQKLKRKFGGSVESILQNQVEFLKEKSQLEELDLNLKDTDENLNALKRELTIKGDKLHQVRSDYAKKLSHDLTLRVRELKMKGATLKIEIIKVDEFLETGLTKINFLAETNPGEGYFKIKDIASGGELSRILLSVRQILSTYDSISIFLFDEIDTGIGGDTANSIGKALTEVAHDGQVIAITHLPQIAQFAQNLIMVQKDTAKTRTESSVREIVGKMILKEVRAMSQLA